MKTLGLHKNQKLCSPTAIERLFAGQGTESAIAFPLRAVWRRDVVRRDDDDPFKFLISIPKKRLRHAVDRVTMRRRVREAYRLAHQAAEAVDSLPADIAFIYVANDIKPSTAVRRSMERLLRKIHTQPLPADEPLEPASVAVD